MPARVVFGWPQKGSGASGFLLMALFAPLLIIRVTDQWSRRDTWEFLMWGALSLLWLVAWPLAILRVLSRAGLNRGWLLPLLLPAALLLVAVSLHWPHRLTSAILMVSIVAPALIAFLSTGTASDRDAVEPPA
jgi:hypothetical protein